MYLTTKEPISIQVFIRHFELAVITVDNIDYAVIERVSRLDELDLAAVMEWVEETYYDCDYVSDAYVPCLLIREDFTL
jgi:hypothetical protein